MRFNVTLRLFPENTNLEPSISGSVIIPNVDIPNAKMVPSPLRWTIRDTPFGSGMDNQIWDCGIQENNVVRIMMFGIGAFGK